MQTVAKHERLVSVAADSSLAKADGGETDDVKYRMVALDLDGTLLGADHKISDASIGYLRYLHSKGFIVAIATGRSPSSTAEVIESLDLSYGKDSSSGEGFPLVCLNGACGLRVHRPQASPEKGEAPSMGTGNAIIDGRLTVKELFHDPVPRDVTVKTLDLAKSMGLVTNYYDGRHIYAQPTEQNHHHLTRRYTELTGTPIVHVKDDYKSVLDRGLPSKLVVFCDTEHIDELHQKLLEELRGEAHVIRGSPPFFVEVLNKDVCKGRGLERMCQTLGVALKESIAFGDGDNDREFLMWAGLGIAMKNARDEVKSVADEVTQWSNAEDGVIRTLKQMEGKGLLRFLDHV